MKDPQGCGLLVDCPANYSLEEINASAAKWDGSNASHAAPKKIALSAAQQQKVAATTAGNRWRSDGNIPSSNPGIILWQENEKATIAKAHGSARSAAASSGSSPNRWCHKLWAAVPEPSPAMLPLL